jgi:hypothetical protein
MHVRRSLSRIFFFFCHNAGTTKAASQLAEKQLTEANKARSISAQTIKNEEAHVKSAAEGQKSAKKSLEKADKNLKRYNKKMDKLTKEASKKKGEAVKQEQKKIEELKKQEQKYESMQASSEKGVAAKKAQIDAELKALEKLKH